MWLGTEPAEWLYITEEEHWVCFHDNGWVVQWWLSVPCRDWEPNSYSVHKSGSLSNQNTMLLVWKIPENWGLRFTAEVCRSSVLTSLKDDRDIREINTNQQDSKAGRQIIVLISPGISIWKASPTLGGSLCLPQLILPGNAFTDRPGDLSVSWYSIPIKLTVKDRAHSGRLGGTFLGRGRKCRIWWLSLLSWKWRKTDTQRYQVNEV